MNKKRSVAILLTVVMLLTMFPANVFAGGYDNCLVGYEHSHNENCYKKLETVSEPQCGFAEEHEHGAECCTITDPEHVHGDGEFCECEIPAHSHTAACYQVVTIVEEPQCGLVEHVHGDA